MSSVPTLASSTTQPNYNFFIPKAIGTNLTSLFQTKPSIYILSNILAAKSFKFYSSSYTLTSKTIIDLAITAFFAGLAYYSAAFFSASFF